MIGRLKHYSVCEPRISNPVQEVRGISIFNQTQKKASLDDSDLVGNVEGVKVCRQLDVCLLGTIGSDQRVHLK